MGYSTNVRTLRTMIPYLDQFIEGQARGWTFTTASHASRWAYKIREAFSIAKANATNSEFSAYADLANKYAVKCTGSSVTLELAEKLEEKIRPNDIVTVDNKTTTVTAPIADIAIVWTADKIAEMCIAKTESDRVHFPNANLSNEELIKLYQWCNTFVPPRLMFVAIGDVTVRHYSDDFADVAWSPDDLR